MNYNPREIEPKWQRYWDEQKTFVTSESSSKPKYYILDMFPYPSGSGLHVGHGIGYTATDIIARYKRMRGFNVLHPMGWDSFGLPAEQYAIRTGTHPATTTEQNIANIKAHLKSYGYSYDWSRELRTSEPSYYKWTQWIFTLLLKKGLAYQAENYVNYCPNLGTVLANEEVADGKSVEGGHPVIRRPLKQWVLKITAYADRLLEDLKLLDWPENLKKQQENWIGRSEGARIDFNIEGEEEKISVFTTRADTLFGITYVVLAPEHPLAAKLAKGSYKEKLEAYLEEVTRKSDLERTDLNKNKSGVFIGTYALHPVTGEKLPIWVADYVLVNYGTGAVMAVPYHDERDFEFANLHNLPKKFVIEPLDKREIESGYFELGRLVASSHPSLNLDGMESKVAQEAVVAWLEKEGKGAREVSYKLRDWLFSRQRYWGEPMPVLHYEDGQLRALDLDELPLVAPNVSDYKPTDDGLSPLAKEKAWVHVVDSKTGRKAIRETHTMPQWAGSCWYYLRFLDPNNSHEIFDKTLENYWMPVDTYVGGAEHAVLHLLYARFWHKVLYDAGIVSTKEPFQQLRNQGMVVAKAYKLLSGGYVKPDEVEKKEGKWIHKPTGHEVKELIEKMSKSKLNGLSPEDVIHEHGADALRLYSMFLGPYDKEKLWDAQAISGCSRFLRRVAALYDEALMSDDEEEKALVLTHVLIKNVEEEIENWQFNVAIAKMMEFLNQFEKLKKYPRSCLKLFVLLLSPFAPHLAEELWQVRLGMEGSIAFAAFPKADEGYLAKAQNESVNYAIQVQGKLRSCIALPRGLKQEEVLEKAMKDEAVIRNLGEKKIAKVIFVQDKLLNLVCS